MANASLFEYIVYNILDHSPDHLLFCTIDQQHHHEPTSKQREKIWSTSLFSIILEICWKRFYILFHVTIQSFKTPLTATSVQEACSYIPVKMSFLSIHEKVLHEIIYQWVIVVDIEKNKKHYDAAMFWISGFQNKQLNMEYWVRIIRGMRYYLADFKQGCLYNIYFVMCCLARVQIPFLINLHL